MRLTIAIAAACLSIVGLSVAADAEAAIRKPTNIPAQALGPALHALAKDRNLQVVYLSDAVTGLRTRGAVGDFTADEALDHLLSGTGLSYRYLDESTVTVFSPTSIPPNGPLGGVPAQSSTRLAQTDQPQSLQGASSTQRKLDDEGVEEIIVTMPEVLVRGSRVLNMDIARSRDDAQPYVVFDRATIEQSGAATLNEFFKLRLTANAVGQTSAQLASDFKGDASAINLRGLGANQTLVLIDGHRAAGVQFIGALSQPDINGIPLAAVERIEVLPTTASGIYGGSATGGVVNIILRRDYSGAELKVNYENTFAADSARRQVDLGAGFSLEEGRTNVLVAASYADANVLTLGERDLVQRGIAQVTVNNPGFYFNSATPPLGSTTNIRSVSGTNLVLKSGIALGSPITFAPAGYAGASSDGGAALVANAGRYNFDLPDTSQTSGGKHFGFTNAPTIESITATVRREFLSSLDAFIDIGASNNTGHFPAAAGTTVFTIPASSPTNPFTQAIRVRVPNTAIDSENKSTSYNRRVVAGLILKLPRAWMAETDYTWNTTRLTFTAADGTDLAAPAVTSGALDVLRDQNLFPADFGPYVTSGVRIVDPFRSELSELTLRVSGPAVHLPAGPATVSVMLAHREEDLEESSFLPPGVASPLIIPSRSQSASSAYLEVRAPLVSADNDVRGMRLLELQLAGRTEELTTKGATQTIPSPATPISRATNKVRSTNPTVGLRYAPAAGLMLRASYGTGFLPPAVNQLIQNAPVQFAPGAFTDPRRGNSTTGALQGITGGNAGLEPEESESWSAGAVLEPRWLSGFRLSVDYTRIDKDDNIATLNTRQVIDNESLFPERVTRGPVPPGDPFGIGPIIAVDSRAFNISRAQAEAWDAQLDYSIESGVAGSFDLFAIGTWQTHLKTQLISSAPLLENVGIGTSNPLKFKGNAGLTWRYGNWRLNWNTQYFHSYSVADPAAASSAPTIANQGSLRVPRQIYHDFFVAYRFDSGGAALLRDTELQLGARNIFDTKPPYDAGNALIYYSYFGDPRLARYAISIKRVF